MPIADTYVPLKSSGNGSTQDFTFNFYIGSTANLRVYEEDDVTLVQTLKALGSDYTATFNDNTPGGNVHFLVAPASGKSIIRARSIPKTQETPLKTSSGFQATVVQTIVDKLTALVQDVYEQISRAVKLPLGSSVTNITLPEPEDDSLIAWDGTSGAMKNLAAADFKGEKGDTGDTGATGAPGADGIMASIVAGTNVTVDDTDPANPIVASTTPKATGADIDTGTEDAEFVTPKAIADSALVSETAWTDYSAVSTIVGWASFGTKEIYYYKIGKLVFVQFAIDGLSNAVTATFTLPFAAKSGSGGLRMGGVINLAADNSTALTTVTKISMYQGGTTVNLYKNMETGAWTASGNKNLYGSFIYAIN